jgi:hypothetical protein
LYRSLAWIAWTRSKPLSAWLKPAPFRTPPGGSEGKIAVIGVAGPTRARLADLPTFIVGGDLQDGTPVTVLEQFVPQELA